MHRGREALDPMAQGLLDQLVAHAGAQALALQRVGDYDRDLGLRGILQPHEAAHADQVAVAVDGDQGHVVVAVDLGEVAQLRGREARLGGQEATLDRGLGEMREAPAEKGLVCGSDGPDANVHSSILFEQKRSLCARRHAGGPRSRSSSVCTPRALRIVFACSRLPASPTAAARRAEERRAAAASKKKVPAATADSSTERRPPLIAVGPPAPRKARTACALASVGTSASAPSSRSTTGPVRPRAPANPPASATSPRRSSVSAGVSSPSQP